MKTLLSPPDRLSFLTFFLLGFIITVPLNTFSDTQFASVLATINLCLFAGLWLYGLINCLLHLDQLTNKFFRTFFLYFGPGFAYTFGNFLGTWCSNFLYLSKL